MNLDHDICYRALRTRDQRFDGRFFTGVTSTGIYCRPVCPARTPQAANCVFFASAAAAEDAGFRACHRCRPETAPGTPAWHGTSATVSRAMRLIGDGALDQASVADLATRLGVGDRHLRRLFAEQLGASPLAMAQTRRVHFAKRMIEETRLPMAQIALAAGFRNVRRFNAAVDGSFHRTPTEIRRCAHMGGLVGSGGVVTLSLSYRAPFDWDGLLGFLEPRAIPGVEVIDDRTYRRTIELEDFTGSIEVEPDPQGKTALLLSAPVDAAPYLGRVADRVRSLFDLDADPEAICDQLSDNQRLASAALRYQGVRVPGAWDRFELAVRAVLGQQVTVTGATRLAGRLVRRFGRALVAADEPRRKSLSDNDATSTINLGWLFPRPADLVDADIASVGMPATRAETIRCLARAVCDGDPILELASGLDEAVQRLTALPGIGDWTAQYIAMRALSEPDAFPAGDLGLRKAIADNETLPTAATLRNLAVAWRPWRAYAAMLLWRDIAAVTRKKIS